MGRKIIYDSVTGEPPADLQPGDVLLIRVRNAADFPAAKPVSSAADRRLPTQDQAVAR